MNLVDGLFKLRNVPRGDELKTHASDLWTCMHAVALRRRGEQPIPLTQTDLVKFQAGHDYEHGVARTLRDAGHTVEEGLDLAHFGLESIHPDLFVNGNLVIETKTTDARVPKPVCQPHHAFQVSVSALAIASERGIPTPRAHVLVRHASHSETDYPVDPTAWEALAIARAEMVVVMTDPSHRIPDPHPMHEVELPEHLKAFNPPKKDNLGGTILPYNECGYCRFTQCPINPKRTGIFQEKAS